MIHIGGSKTQECKDCGSRLIENEQCLTCDSINLGQLIVCESCHCDTLKENTVLIESQGEIFCLDCHDEWREAQ